MVEEHTRAVLHCSASLDPGIWRAIAAGTRSSLGSASWTRDGEAYRGTAWPQFMGAGFGTQDWVVVASQPERYQLERAIEFRKLYIPVVVLALLLVTWLTIRQARDIVGPVLPACIEIEITEGVLAERGAAVEELLGQLSAMGHSIALDDFGTGFSSMAYLKRFPVHTIKIDRVFVDGIGRGADSSAIVSAVIAMAHALGKSVTAEGVETREQYETLRALGCDLIQGYLLSPALPAAEFEALVRARMAGPVFA